MRLTVAAGQTLESQVLLPGCDTTNCAVPGEDSHNNTILTLERCLLAAGTGGYADEKSGTSLECAVRVLVRVTEIRVLCTHTQSLSGRSVGGLDRAAALPGQLLAASAIAGCRRAREV